MPHGRESKRLRFHGLRTPVKIMKLSNKIVLVTGGKRSFDFLCRRLTEMSAFVAQKQTCRKTQSMSLSGESGHAVLHCIRLLLTHSGHLDCSYCPFVQLPVPPDPSQSQNLTRRASAPGQIAKKVGKTVKCSVSEKAGLHFWEHAQSQ